MNTPSDAGDDYTGPTVWPRPPDLPRYLHEISLYGSSGVMLEEEEQRLRRVLTGTKRQEVRFEKPFAVAAWKGRLYVTDTAVNQVHVFDLQRRRYFRLGYRLEGKLVQPLGIDVDHQGNVYVVDRKRSQVIVYDALGLYQREFGGEEQLSNATAVAASPDGQRIYVVNTGTIDNDLHKVLIYDGDGKLLKSVGTRGHEQGEFNLPVDAAVDPQGNLYVLDAGNFRVQVFDAEGNFLRSWGSLGKSFGQFARPRSISSDAEGNIYVSDTEFGNIQVFNADGQLLMAIGQRGFSDQPGRFQLLAGIAVDDTQRLYAVDQKLKKLEVIRKLGEPEGMQLLNTIKDSQNRE